MRDTIAPGLILPEEIVRTTTNPRGRPVHYAVDVLDLGSDKKDITLTYSHAPNSLFPLGTTSVTVTATDRAGNVATGTFTITVILVEEDDDEGDDDDGDDDDRKKK